MNDDPFAHNPDWCEIIVEVLGDERFKLERLVAINRRTEERVDHVGVVDEHGDEVIYERATEILHTLRSYLDEKKTDLWIQLKFEDDPWMHSDFYEQIDKDGARWAYWDHKNPLDTTDIPRGGFCIDCLYHANRRDKPEQEDGYCAYLGYGDWMSPPGYGGVLWDGIKMCGVNDHEVGQGEQR